MNFFIEIITRLKTDSPRFFIILRYTFGALGAAALVAKWMLLREILNPAHGPIISEVCGYILTAAGAIWGVSFLPVKTADAPTDPKDPPPPKP